MSLYIGRFAPSPSGKLHFGSLIAALGSFLQARSNNGLWQIRIEDIDPEREVPGASDDILETLIAFGMNWDGEVIYQSDQSDNYDKILNKLQNENLCYPCSCTRKIIKENGAIYKGACRDLKLSPQGNALRLNLSFLNSPITGFCDQLQGYVSFLSSEGLNLAVEDFVLKRKDGEYAYNLAVVIDDIKQGVTEVVRGADLLPVTGKQLSLYKLLKQPAPNYLHLPLAVTKIGSKLSKQNHARGLDKKQPIPTLLKALDFLGHRVPSDITDLDLIIKWAITNWSIKKIPQKKEIIILY